jgi:hypothetical protein
MGTTASSHHASVSRQTIPAQGTDRAGRQGCTGTTLHAEPSTRLTLGLPGLPSTSGAVRFTTASEALRGPSSSDVSMRSSEKEEGDGVAVTAVGWDPRGGAVLRPSGGDPSSAAVPSPKAWCRSADVGCIRPEAPAEPAAAKEKEL